MLGFHSPTRHDIGFLQPVYEQFNHGTDPKRKKIRRKVKVCLSRSREAGTKIRISVQVGNSTREAPKNTYSSSVMQP